MRLTGSFLTKYSLVAALLLLILAFSLLKPAVFPTLANAGSIMSDNAVLTLVALGVMIPLIVGQFDLSPGFVASLSVMLTAGLLSRQGLPWPLVLLIVLAVGALIGLLMGVLVGYLGLNSLIVSLGAGSAVSGLVLMYSNGQIIFQGIPKTFLALGQTRLFGVLPLPFLYAIVTAIVIWFVLSMRPVGRKLYAIGGGSEAARLVGIDLRRFTAGAFMASSMMACLAGFIQVARLGAGHPTSAQSLLLPAFAAAFLGATAFRPGFYNVWGTVFAVYLVGAGTTRALHARGRILCAADLQWRGARGGGDCRPAGRVAKGPAYARGSKPFARRRANRRGPVRADRRECLKAHATGG